MYGSGGRLFCKRKLFPSRGVLLMITSHADAATVPLPC